jgi:uncharacterized protein (TIGR00297 family)
VLASGVVAGLGWRAGALSIGGGIAGVLIGTLILLGAGWQGGAVLAAFFVSSSLVSSITSRRSPAGVLDAKGNRRDAWQVLANGGAAAVAGVIASPPSLLSIWLVSASLAAAASDTWATSIGLLSPTPPRLLWNNRPVPAGTSGGVTMAGIAGGIVGAGIVGLTAALVTGRSRLALGAMLVGFAGMLMDSLLGGTLQGRFYCVHCGQDSEWKRHRCGCTTEFRGGLAWLNNDAVNGLATTLAALLAWALWYQLD